MLCMGQRGFSGTGQTEHRSYILASIRQRILLLSAVAACIAVSVGQRPYHGQSSFLVLSEIFHTKNCRAVLIGIKIAEGQRIAQAAEIKVRTLHRYPLGIGEDIDIRLFSLADRFGVFIHLHILVGHVLEIDHPVIQKVLLSFRNQKMNLYHKFRIKSCKAGCMIHGFPTGLIYGIHNDLVEFFFINTRLALDAARLCVTSGHGTVVEQKNLCILFKTKLLAFVYRHVGHDGSRRIFCQIICFLQGVHFYYIVPVESCFNNGTCF